ncbi:MAG TPA: DUF2934 domain-containing protein [Blastocatellia bacterium]|nr:DUF2934 domain-containing protein [Blastocatellia bacterium]
MARPGKSKRIEEENGISSQAIEQPDIEQTAAENTPTDEQIRLRAYEIYLERGGGDGNDAEDWLQAERELQGTPGDQDIAE